MNETAELKTQQLCDMKIKEIEREFILKESRKIQEKAQEKANIAIQTAVLTNIFRFQFKIHKGEKI